MYYCHLLDFHVTELMVGIYLYVLAFDIIITGILFYRYVDISCILQTYGIILLL